MTTVALAGCTRVADPDHEALAAALARIGIEAVAYPWDAPGVAWDRFDATVIRSTWDYPQSLEAFHGWARSVPRLVNPAPVVEWNTDKRYLEALRAAGVPTIETTYASSSEDASLPDGSFVVKPVVGGGSRGVIRFEPDEHDHARRHVDELAAAGHVAMIQPFVDSVASHGETDVIVLDGVVSHAVVKRAPLGTAGAPTAEVFSAVEAAAVDPAHAAIATAALAVVPWHEPLCFARVDLVATAAGPAVLEVELVEPFLFLGTDPAASHRVAAAIARRCTPAS